MSSATSETDINRKEEEIYDTLRGLALRLFSLFLIFSSLFFGEFLLVCQYNFSYNKFLASFYFFGDRESLYQKLDTASSSLTTPSSQGNWQVIECNLFWQKRIMEEG